MKSFYHSFSAHHGELMFNERGSGRGRRPTATVVIGDPSVLR